MTSTVILLLLLCKSYNFYCIMLHLNRFVLEYSQSYTTHLNYELR